MTDRLQQEDRRVFELHVLNDVGSVCATVRTADEILARSTRLIADSLFPDNCGFLLLDCSRQVLVPHQSFVVTNSDGVPRTIPLSVGLTGKTARTGRPCRVGNVTLDQDYLRSDVRSHSELCLPLRVHGEIIGVFNIESSQSDAFSEADERLMTAVLDIVGAGLERLQQQEKLQASEARLRQMLESLPLGVLVHDDEKIHYANSMALRIIGVGSSSHVHQMSPFEIFALDQRERVRHGVRTLLETRKPIPSFETQIVRPDGSLIDVEVHSTWIEYAGDDCVQLHLSDISERKLAERSRLVSERRLRELADSIPQIVWIADADGGLLQLNAKTTEYTGVAMDDLTGWSWEKVIHPEDLPGTVARWKECLSDGKSRDISFRIRRSDGEFRWHIAREIPVHDHAGAVTTWYGTCTDIENLKRAEELLQEHESRFRLLFEGAADGIIWADAETGLLTHCNRAAEMLLGRERSELIGQPQSFLHPLEDADCCRWLFEDQSGQPFTSPVECQLLHKSGRRIHVAVSRSVTTIGGQRIVQGIFRDVSERKQSEALIQKLSTFREAIIRTAAEGICVYFPSAEHPFVSFSIWNDRMTEITGYTMEEINKFGWYQSLYPDPEIQLKAQQRMDRMRVGDDLRDEEWEITRKDGERRKVSISTSAVELEEGISGVAALIHDVTERRKADAAWRSAVEDFRRSEERFAKLFHASPFSIIVASYPEGKIIEANDAFLNLFEFQQHEVIGRTTGELDIWVLPGDRQRMLDSLVTHGAARNMEYLFRTKTGRQLSIVMSVEIIRLDGQDFSLAMSIDITDRKLAEQALRNREERLRESEHRLRLAIHATKVGPWDWDIQSGKVTFSDEWKRQFGYESDELEDRFEEWESRLHPDDRANVLGVLSDYLEQRRAEYEIEFRMRHRDGTYRWIYTRGEAIRDQDGRPLHVFGCHLDVTDRKMAELAIRESEERYRKLFETSGDGIFVLDHHGTIRSANPVAAAMHGYTLGELVGKSMRELDVPHDANRIPDRMKRVLAGETLRFEVTHFRKDKSEIVLDVIATPLQLSDEPLVLAFDRDITDRKRMENTLRHILEAIAPASGEDYFQALTNHLARACRMDLAFIGVFEENGTWVRTLAVSMQGDAAPNFSYALANTPCERLLHQDFCRYPHSVQGLFPEDRLLAEMKIESYLGIPLISTVGRPVGILVLLDRKELAETTQAETLLNVVARQAAAELEREFAERARLRALQSLQESELFLRMTQEAAHVGSWEWDVEGGRLKCSAELARMYGIPPEEFDGTMETAISLCDGESAKRFQMFLSRLCDGHNTEGVECRILRRDGTVCDLWFVGQLREDDELQSHKVMGVAIDITDRKREEVHRQLLAGQLAQAQKLEAIGRLAGGVAHDFNNILIVINGYAQLLLEMSELSDPRHRMLTEISKAGERAATLTQQLLNYSRKQVASRKVLDANEVVGEMETMLRQLIGENIRLTMAYQNSPAMVTADAGQIGQVVMNLVVNARDAMPEGGTLTVAIDSVEPGSALLQAIPGVQSAKFVRLSVADTGCGIPPDLLDRIFEPFFTTKGVGAGTGLGLASVRSIAEEGGGFVHVHCTPGQGSTFEFYLPAVNAEATKSPVEVLRTSRGRETILIVEDEPPVRSVMRLFLEQSGYKVLEVSGAAEALRISPKEMAAVDLLITDVVMPEMNGRELVTRIMALRPDIRYLFVSGYSTDDIVRRGVLNADVELLQKPFSPTALAAKVREILDQPPSVVQP